MINASVLGLIGALVIGGAAGFMVGKKTIVEPEKQSGDPGVTRSARRSAPAASFAASGLREGSSPGMRVNSTSEALALPGHNNRLKALMDYYAGLAPSQFQEEADKLEELPWSERIMLGHLLFAQWGEEDPTAAMAYTKTMGFAGTFVKRTVMRSWASKFPQDAAHYFSSNPSEFRMGGMMGGRGRGSSAASVIAMEWARQDSTGAMAWAQTLEGSDERDAMQGMFRQVAAEDPSKAAGMLASITDEEARKTAQNTIAREWGSKNWGAAKGWIAGLPSDQQQDATARALRGMSDTDATGAAAEIGVLMEGDARDDTVASIARNWSRENPAAAAAWLGENGSADAQAASIGSVVSSWVGRDPVAALEFTQQQPEGPVRDTAVSSYVIANQSGDIQQNLSLAESISDNGMRRRAIGITAVGWMRQDKEAATQYLDTTEALSDQERQRIKRFAEGGGH